MLDLAQLRLQYEILNKPLEAIAAENNISAALLADEAKAGNWKQYWPEPDLDLSVVDEDADKDENLALQAEQFLDKSKRRLAVYNIAKEILLAQRYCKLEQRIIDCANDLLDSTMDARSAKALSTLYKDMTSKSISNALASLSFGEDEGGLPTVIVRDLSGR